MTDLVTLYATSTIAIIGIVLIVYARRLIDKTLRLRDEVELREQEVLVRIRQLADAQKIVIETREIAARSMGGKYMHMTRAYLCWEKSEVIGIVKSQVGMN